MSNKWIVDVLCDLRSFAVINNLPHLADQLGDAVVVAMAETATTDTETQKTPMETGVN